MVVLTRSTKAHHVLRALVLVVPSLWLSSYSVPAHMVPSLWRRFQRRAWERVHSRNDTAQRVGVGSLMATLTGSKDTTVARRGVRASNVPKGCVVLGVFFEDSIREQQAPGLGPQSTVARIFYNGESPGKASFKDEESVAFFRIFKVELPCSRRPLLGGGALRCPSAGNGTAHGRQERTSETRNRRSRERSQLLRVLVYGGLLMVTKDLAARTIAARQCKRR